MNKVVAVIPVRDSYFANTSLCKDLLPFGNSNLLEHKIRQLKAINNIDVLVTTESKTIADIATKQQVEVLCRPEILSMQQTPFRELVHFVCEHTSYEHILWACVTSPFITANIYQRAVALYIEKLKEGYDSLVTVQKMQRYLFDNNGTLNFRISELKPIEKLPELYIFTNGISLAPRLKMKQWGYTSGTKAYKMILNKLESVDICDVFDYECAKFFLNFRESSV